MAARIILRNNGRLTHEKRLNEKQERGGLGTGNDGASAKRSIRITGSRLVCPTLGMRNFAAIICCSLVAVTTLFCLSMTSPQSPTSSQSPSRRASSRLNLPEECLVHSPYLRDSNDVRCVLAFEPPCALTLPVQKRHHQQFTLFLLI